MRIERHVPEVFRMTERGNEARGPSVAQTAIGDAQGDQDIAMEPDQGLAESWGVQLEVEN
jgi:hypothetical protein